MINGLYGRPGQARSPFGERRKRYVLFTRPIRPGRFTIFSAIFRMRSDSRTATLSASSYVAGVLVARQIFLGIVAISGLLAVAMATGEPLPWVKNGRPTSQAEQMRQALSDAELHGLSSASYSS